MSNQFQNIFGCIPLQQAWAYRSHFLRGHFTFLRQQKLLYAGIKQKNFINMPKHAYRNISNTFLHVS